LLEVLVQAAAVGELQNEVHMLLVVEVVVELYDVFMVHLLHQLDLQEDLPTDFLIIQPVLFYAFEGE
jgi:hypothetical protein